MCKNLGGQNEEAVTNFSQLCPLKRAIGTDEKTWNSIQRQKPLCFYCAGDQSVDRVAQRGYGASILGGIENWPWETCFGCPNLSRGIGQDDLQKTFPVSIILWFSDCVCQTISQFELFSTLFQILWKMSSSILTGMGGSLNRKNVLAATLIFLFILTGILLFFSFSL